MNDCKHKSKGKQTLMPHPRDSKADTATRKLRRELGALVQKRRTL